MEGFHEQAAGGLQWGGGYVSGARDIFQVVCSAAHKSGTLHTLKNL